MNAALTPDDWMASLNEAQKLAVTHEGTPLIVLAGPGTGKTRVIVARLRRLLDQGIEPEHLLALTFSNKAAGEIRERIGDALGARVGERVRASTFHAFAMNTLRRFGDMIGLRSDMDIMDVSQQRRIARGLVQEHGLLRGVAPHDPSAAGDAFLEFLEACRHASKSAADAAQWAKAWQERLESGGGELEGEELEAEQFRQAAFADCARLMALYEKECKARKLMSYDDLQGLCVELLAKDPRVGLLLRQDVRHIVVDEFQDADRAQIEMLRYLAPPEGRATDLCVVGDDDQSIYGFRGAEPRTFSHFKELWKDATTIPLEINYRSGSEIVRVAGEHIRRSEERFAEDKVLRAAPKSGAGVVEGIVINHDSDSVSVIASMILDDLQGDAASAKEPRKNYSSYAVLAPTNDSVDQIASGLRAQGFPVRAQRSESVADDPGVMDLMAWLRLVSRPNTNTESVDLQRLLVRPPMFVPFESIAEWSAAYRRAGYRRRDEGAEAGEELEAFGPWLRAHAAGDSAVRSVFATLDALRSEALSTPADRMVERIIAVTGLGHAEDLTPRETATRVANLVRVLGFARNRQAFLDAPGGAAQLLAYCDDFVKETDLFKVASLEPNEAEMDEEGEPGTEGAVTVLTAHKAKGLEFDTVFVVKVRPRGFPPSKRDRSDGKVPIPEEFLGRERSSHDDESRRLFYVACTRAEQRLVLLAEQRKSKSKLVDYFNELTGGDDPIPVRDADEVLRRREEVGGGIEAELGEERLAERRRDALIAKGASTAKYRAYAALHDAFSAEVDAGALAEINDRLALAAMELHALEYLRQRRELPDNLRPEVVERLAGVVERFRQDLGPVSITQPMKAPLKLSYSMLKAYMDCPRCFYLKYCRRLDEPKTSDLEIGNIVHKSLERFYFEWRDAEANGRATPGIARALSLGREMMRGGGALRGTADDVDPAKVETMLRMVIERLHDPSANVLHVEEAFPFTYFTGDAPEVAHSMTAKIDRIDQLTDGRLRLVDYKTGGASKKYLSPERTDLQLCIYAMAIAQEFGDSGEVDGVAEYWLLATGQSGGIPLGNLNINSARKKIDKAIAGMLEGRFPKGKSCYGSCDIFAWSGNADEGGGSDDAPDED